MFSRLKNKILTTLVIAEAFTFPKYDKVISDAFHKSFSVPYAQYESNQIYEPKQPKPIYEKEYSIQS